MKSLQDLVLARGRLVERSRNERAAIAQSLAPLQGVDRIVSRAWPLAAAGAAAALLARPRGLTRWLRYAITARQVWRFFRKA